MAAPLLMSLNYMANKVEFTTGQRGKISGIYNKPLSFILSFLVTKLEGQLMDV